MASGEELQSDQLAHAYSAVELGEILEVLRKLIKAQQVLLRVNQEYIHSASQDEAFRTEPRFQLQGSYRNMNKLAEKIVPVMNEDELRALIDDHYVGEAQTLTTGAEHNMLKLAELRGVMTPAQEERWEEIKSSFSRVKAMGGGEDDPVARVTGTLGLVSDRLSDIGRQISVAREAAAGAGETVGLGEALVPWVEKLHQNLSEIAAVRNGSEGAGTPSSAFDPETVDQFRRQLSQVSNGLESIGQAIIEAAKARPSTEVDALLEPAAPAAPSADLTPYLERLNQAITVMAETRQVAASVPPPPPGAGLSPYLDWIRPWR
jgi:uncharacterized protein YukE